MTQELPFTDMILNPEKFFKKPEQVLLLEASNAMKIRILQGWEDELLQLEHCDEENMPDEESSSHRSDLLRDVHNCLISIQD